MWWLRRSLLLVLLLPLAACGFRPLYAERAEAVEEPSLAAIKVLPIRDRIGQELEWSLRESFNPRDIPVEPRYTLTISLTTTRVDLGLQRDATSTRARVDVYANFVLADVGSGKPVYSGRTQSTSAFNVLTDAYTAQVAEEDARSRTVRDLSEDIRTRLALFLRHQRAG